MSDKEAQVNWDDDGRDIEQLRAELAQAQRQLATTVQRCGYCDYRATGADAFNIVAEHIKSCPKHPLAETLVELAQAREELVTADAAMDAVQALWRSPAEVERQDVNLAQACAELKDLQGANRAYEQQLKNLISSGSVANGNRDFWFETCHEAEAERDKARKEAQAQSDLVQHDWLSPCQKAGLEGRVKSLRALLKHAEGERDYWLREHDALAHGCHSETTTELSERLAALDAAETALAEARRVAGLWYRRAQEAQLIAHDRDNIFYEEYSKRLVAEQRATRAEALAQLVTPGLANLLVLLAHDASDTEDARDARELAEQIREALDDT